MYFSNQNQSCCRDNYPVYQYHNQCCSNNNYNYAIILVLFILLVIVLGSRFTR